MTLLQVLRDSYRQLQQGWAGIADRAFRNAAPARQEDMARGEFISAFICKTDLTFPAPTRERQARR